MSEPIKLRKGDQALTVYAPSEARRLVAQEGWKYADVVSEKVADDAAKPPPASKQVPAKKG